MESLSRHANRRTAAMVIVVAVCWALAEPVGQAVEQGVGRLSDSQQIATPEPPPPWRWRLTLPASGLRKAWGTFGGSSSKSSGIPLLLATLSREIATGNASRSWIVEGGIGWILERSLPRFVLRMGAGPSLRLLDTRRASGRGSTLALQALVGISYWGEGYDWIHGSSSPFPTLLGGMLQAGVEAVRFTSEHAGWCLRLRGVAEGPFLRDRPAVFESDGVTSSYDVKASVSVYLDLGRAW